MKHMKQGNLAPLMETEETVLQHATVISVYDGIAVIRLSNSALKARVAFSCLVWPEPGDRVLCSRDETGTHYILSIVERPGDQNMTLSFPANATIQTKEGSISMLSGRSVTMAAADKLSFFSGHAIHKSREAVVDFDEVTANGKRLQANFETVCLVSQMVNTMVKNLVERVKNYIRHTEDYDRVNAGQMTRKVDGLYAMDSRHTVMVSKKDTKIDGERIHMG